MAQTTKIELRKQFLSLRPGSSKGLDNQLTALAQRLQKRIIASYVPLKSEPDVSGFNNWAAENGELWLPRLSGQDLVFAQGELFKGELGLMQPNGEETDPSRIELVIVPALAADGAGHRLGKGKGFYDRWLPLTNAVKVAVVFENELVVELPHESHDQRVDFVVTPNRIIEIER